MKNCLPSKNYRHIKIPRKNYREKINNRIPPKNYRHIALPPKNTAISHYRPKIPPYHATAKPSPEYKAQPCGLTACVFVVKWLTQQRTEHQLVVRISPWTDFFFRLFLESIQNITEGLLTQDGTQGNVLKFLQ